MFLCSFYLLLVNHLGNWANPGLSDHKVLSRQKKEKEREGGAGALITAGIEEKRAGPYQVKMPYTFGDEDGWFPEGGERWG